MGAATGALREAVGWWPLMASCWWSGEGMSVADEMTDGLLDRAERNLRCCWLHA